MQEPKHINKIAFTIADFLDATANCADDAQLYDASMTPEYVIKSLAENKLSHFDPIEDFYEPGVTIIAYSTYVVEHQRQPITLREFKDWFASNPTVTLSSTIKRDIEDGYVFSEYDNIIYTKNTIILC